MPTPSALSTTQSVSFEPARIARKLPQGSIDAFGFFASSTSTSAHTHSTIASQQLPISQPLTAQRLTLSASVLDPRAWSSLIAARYAHNTVDSQHIAIEPIRLNSEVLPDVVLYTTDDRGSRTVFSDDWRTLSRRIEQLTSSAQTLYPNALSYDIDRLDAIIDQDLIDTLFAVIAASEHPQAEHLERRDFLHGAQRHAALRRVFYARLGWLDEILAHRPFVLGSQLTDADLHVFGVLLTFDIGYRNAFPVPDAAIVDYPHLWEYARRIYQIPGLVTDDDRRAIGLLPQLDGSFAQPWGTPAFTETVDDIRTAWNA